MNLEKAKPGLTPLPDASARERASMDSVRRTGGRRPLAEEFIPPVRFGVAIRIEIQPQDAVTRRNSAEHNRAYFLLPAFLSGLALVGLTACGPTRRGEGTTTPAVVRASEGAAQRSPESAASGGEITGQSQHAIPQVAPDITERTISPEQIPNFHVVHPFLLRGAAPTTEGLRRLKAIGVRTVIDLRIAPKKVAAERRTVEALGMRFINLPMSGDPPTKREVKTFLAEATDPAHPPLFVHCQHGADRTGTLVGIYRERVDGWSFDRAYREMRRYGFDPHWRRLTATVRQYAGKDSAL